MRRALLIAHFAAIAGAVATFFIIGLRISSDWYVWVAVMIGLLFIAYWLGFFAQRLRR